MRTLAGLALGLAAAFLYFQDGGLTPTHASHTFSPTYRWLDLEGAGRDHAITYGVCQTSPPATWTQGIEEKWDAILLQWEFSPTGACSGDVRLDWEGPLGSCPDLGVGCFNYFWVTHDEHRDFTSAVVLFDVNHPEGHTFSSFGPNFQTEISAHEWGHSLGLADHAGTQCNEGTLMANQDVDRKATDNPCYLGPTGADRDGVTCVAYDYCDSAPESGDFDGDGRTDLIHICCADYAHIYYFNTNGTFIRYTFLPWAGYGMQSGDWRFGDFNGDGRTDILHLCCPDYANLFLATTVRGTFTRVFFQPWPNYGMQTGVWRVGDFDADGRSDLAHMCCIDYGNIFYSNGGTTFSRYAFQPWPAYGIQLGVWLTGDLDGFAGADLVHLWGPSDGNLFYFGTTRGSFTHRYFQPAPNYGMQLGVWRAGKINGDGTTDLLHVCCSDYANIFHFSGTQGGFTRSIWQPRLGYGMQTGHWRIANLDGAYGGDLVHLCCDSYAELWYSTSTNGAFTERTYAFGTVRSTRWRDGFFDGGNSRRDLAQICCADFGNIWLSNASQGSFTYKQFRPRAGYPMQKGKWR